MIRLACNDDCYNLAALSTYVWLETYAKEGIRSAHSQYVLSHFTPVQYQQLLRSKNHRVIAVTTEQNVIGLSVVNLTSFWHDPAYGYEIERLYIHPDARRSGLGRAVFDYIKSQFGDRFWLYTWDKNESNAFYQHLGFSKVGEHQFHFDDQVVNNNVFAYASRGDGHDN